MRPVFADTCYWVALLSPRDVLAGSVDRFSRTTPDLRILTSEMVLVEVLNFFAGSGPRSRRTAVETVRRLGHAQSVDVVPQTSWLFHEATSLFASREDKDWSLTDCATMILMREHGLTDILTADHHFAQAGFTTLLHRETP